MLKNCIMKLMQGQKLDHATCQQAFHEMLTAEVNPLQVAAFLVLLRAKTETVEELSALAEALQQKMISVPTKHKVLDIVGTGGDHAHTINISTGSAILAASCGVKVAKHGNRAVSSLAGSADVLEALGVAIDLTPEKISACIDEVGIGFCYSPNFHPLLQNLRIIRKQLNVPTTFNLLGPLLNPASPAHILLGIFDESLLELMAQTLKQIGTERSLVVHGSGLDEISCVGPSKIFEVTQTNVSEFILDPEKLGLPRCTAADLKGGDAQMNAQLLLETLSLRNAKKEGAIANTFILNAAVALYLYGLASSISDAIDQACTNLYNGAAANLLKNWIEFSHD